MIIKILFAMVTGLAGGLAVGSGFVAFLTVLGIVPRLTQLTKTIHRIRHYEWAVVLGAVLGGWVSLADTIFFLPSILLIPIGLASGIFNGMLAAALTEVLNVMPLLSKRIGVQEKIVVLMMALVLGKVIGSLFQWIFFVDL
ncbi:stage V sporulation protein AB [Peribacillus deserti]|uniref:Stage V sporulation protein AB n=1 Tax=Peribacillus deserti TaxID=673318 RepID=A0A2N5M1X1_9BACI|nr:stage V sporulation protein AB [Peribacillus deserti]PLT28273.1 stage V sporulation protein AB [Peribacillus deserti]